MSLTTSSTFAKTEEKVCLIGHRAFTTENLFLVVSAPNLVKARLTQLESCAKRLEYLKYLIRSQ